MYSPSRASWDGKGIFLTENRLVQESLEGIFNLEDYEVQPVTCMVKEEFEGVIGGEHAVRGIFVFCEDGVVFISEHAVCYTAGFSGYYIH